MKKMPDNSIMVQRETLEEVKEIISVFEDDEIVAETPKSSMCLYEIHIDRNKVKKLQEKIKHLLWVDEKDKT